jgi:hypothetical protein
MKLGEVSFDRNSKPVPRGRHAKHHGCVDDDIRVGPGGLPPCPDALKRQSPRG